MLTSDIEMLEDTVQDTSLSRMSASALEHTICANANQIKQALTCTGMHAAGVIVVEKVDEVI